MSDLQAALDRMRKHAAINTDAESPYWTGFEWDRAAMADDNGIIVADYPRLTDPTPLTEQVLRDAGFVVIPESNNKAMKHGVIEVYVGGDRNLWTVKSFGLAQCLAPRNVGELNQLLRRVNGGGE